MRHRCCSVFNILYTFSSAVSVPVPIVRVWPTCMTAGLAAGGVFAEGNAGGGIEAPPRGAPSGAERGSRHGRTRGCHGPARHNEGVAYPAFNEI